MIGNFWPVRTCIFFSTGFNHLQSLQQNHLQSDYPQQNGLWPTYLGALAPRIEEVLAGVVMFVF
jgi:hypothetical protein